MATQMPAGHAAGAAPRQTTASTTALATEARHRLADHLARDATFRRELLQRLNVLPFRGTVTAINRDSSGTNQVKIQRTGMTHADANWYDVFAPKTVPIVGDEVLLEYVSHAPTAMVSQTRKGGRPDEQDVPYTGGSLRRYDSTRKAVHKHDDGHNGYQYDTDGTTVRHIDTAPGHKKHAGDHYHNATLDSSGNHSGAYGRKTVSGGVLQEYLSVSTVERLLRDHDGNLHRLYAALGQLALTHDGTKHSHYSGGSVKATLEPSGANGHKLRVAASAGIGAMHEFGDDGSSGNLRAVHGPSGHVAWDHSDTVHQVYTSGVVRVKHQAAGSNGGQALFTASAGVGAYHALGDDGSVNGLLYALHGPSGHRAWDHDGTTHQHYANGTVQVKMQSGINGTGGAVALGTTAGGGQYHAHSDDGAGALLHRSYGTKHLLDVDNGANRHTKDKNGHTFPSGAKISAPTTDNSRVDVLASGGAGGIKQASHSINSYSNSVSGLTITPTGALLVSIGTPTGGSTTVPLFKHISSVVYYTGPAPSVTNAYKFAAPHPAYCGNLGTPVYSSSFGSQDTQRAWVPVNTCADGSTDIYAQAFGGLASQSVGMSYVALLVNA